LCLAAGLEAKVAVLPRGIDPADLVFQQGADALQAVLADAVSYLAFVREAVAQAGNDRPVLEKGVHQVLSTIAVVPDPIRREYMLRETADLFDLGVDLLRETMRELSSPTAAGKPSAPAGAPARPASRAAEQTAKLDAIVETIDALTETGPRRPAFRTLTGLHRSHVEAVLLAHVLQDKTGAAARLLLDLGAGLTWSTGPSAILVEELGVWSQEGGRTPPRDFIEQRWHVQDAAYRKHVTDLLARDIPPDGETERAVRESLQRLRETRGAQHG
ncbi:MAG: hypothetical protein R6X35_15315, partial [Candidatus Krumholzibacteriia bacterium]